MTDQSGTSHRCPGQGPREAPTFRLAHCPALDGLRGVAILLVLNFHAGVPPCRGGFIGVDLFFVLSGFLITALLLQEHRDAGAIRLRAFYGRRALRLLPALLAMVVACCLYALARAGPGRLAATLWDALSVLGYYANWQILSAGEHNPMFRHTWSLALEEQFYLVWPWLLALLLALRVRRGGVVALVLLGIVLPACARNLRWTGPESWVPLYHGTETRADGLCTGCLLALAVYGWPALQRPVPRLLLRLAVLPAVAVLAWHALTDFRYLQGYVCRGGFTVVSFCSAVLIAAAVCGPPAPLRRVLGFAPLRWLGRISYGLYLWHTPVYVAVSHAGLTHNLWSQAWLKVSASLAAATVCYYALERPFLRWKERLAQARKRNRAGDTMATAPPHSPHRLRTADSASCATSS